MRTLALQLGQLIGLDARQPLPELQLKLSAQPRSPAIALSEALATAIAERPELRALRKARDLQSYEVDRYFGELFPKLGLVGLVDSANPNQRIFPLVEEYNTTWVVQATLTWSPNDFVVQRSLYKEAQEQLKGLEADLKGLRQAVELELASVISDLKPLRALYRYLKGDAARPLREKSSSKQVRQLPSSCLKENKPTEKPHLAISTRWFNYSSQKSASRRVLATSTVSLERNSNEHSSQTSNTGDRNEPSPFGLPARRNRVAICNRARFNPAP